VEQVDESSHRLNYNAPEPILEAPPSWVQCELLGEYRACLDPWRAKRLAAACRTTEHSIRQLRVGWSRGQERYTIALRRGNGTLAGMAYFDLCGRLRIRGEAGLVLDPAFWSAKTKSGPLTVTTSIIDFLALAPRLYSVVGAIPDPPAASEALIDFWGMKRPRHTQVLVANGLLNEAMVKSLSALMRHWYAQPAYVWPGFTAAAMLDFLSPMEIVQPLSPKRDAGPNWLDNEKNT
jgi:hypothetical protein